MKPRIYNKSMQMIGVLQNASNVGYVHKFNDLYTASFKLPVDDPKNSLCEAYNIVDIFDGNISKGKYRILDSPDSEISEEGAMVEYSCEHVIAFLLNEVIDGYLELGGTGVNTRTVIETILSKQATVRWQLGTCQFNHQFQYSWENTNCLDALFSVPTCFDEDYHWTYDTSTFPWTINLLKASTTRSCEIRRKRNMVSIKRSIDSSQLCTRLYCKGYGEGVNQLTIAEVNNGKGYLDDATAQAKYGILSSHLIDRRFTDMAHLKAYGQQVLNKLKEPLISYAANAIDLNRITGYDWDKLDEGRIVRVVDPDKGIDTDAPIIEFKKPDVDDDPLNIDITISNKSSDVTSDIDSLAQRAAITSQYSQGATNLYCEQFADNADSTHPAKMKIYIPESCARINQVLLNWECAQFRAYSKSALGGGGSTVTSASGGGSTVTSADGGGTTAVTPVTNIGGSTGSSVNRTAGPTGAGGQGTQYTNSAEAINSGGSVTSTGSADPYTGYESDHVHAGPSHRHEYPGDSGYTKYGGTGSTGKGSSHRHQVSSHSHSIDNHYHKFDHTHYIYNITLPQLSVTIPDHHHSVTIPEHSHDITIPEHTHDLEFGIYEGETATSCTLKVDSETARTGVTSGSDIDIIPYLAKDNEGKITRGVWHTIEIVPDKMTRIEADLFVKTFITSYTGGNY